MFLASFFYASEGYLRQWQVQAGGFARHSLCWCFGVARPAFWKPFRGLWGLFLASFFYPSEGYLRQWQVQAGGFARHSLCWCFGVARPTFWKPFRGLFLASFFYPSEGYLRQWVQAGFFSTRQKVTLGIGGFRLGASLVTASAGVSTWRGRLFGSLLEACGACFWLLFSTRQKVTLGITFCFFPLEIAS